MKKQDFFCILKITEYFGTDPDPLVRGSNPRTWIRTVPKCHGSGTLLQCKS
jgi:hypothetical protein